ncbi:kinase-like domain-containing protein [Hyaloraphidium curvatum]|nr:kinase-like domain-containing protein [Hyaloraphidium curvatum]
MAGKPVVLRADTDYLLEEKDVDIDHKAIIGEGGFGQVFRGKLHGITDVAVKKCRTWRAHGEARDYFRDELLAWARMPPRPNVVPLLGYHLNPDFLVTRYYPHCNLKKYLAGKGWPVRESLKLLHDAAKGMVFIHASHIVHSDLKAENVLVDVDSGDHATALVTDFGLAKRRVKFESGESRYEGARGFSLHFAAPELLTPRGATKPSSDVWSFGMMCYQVLMCGALPYANRGTDHVIRYAISRGEHPTLESAFRIPPALRELMVCCWDFTPERRPTMAEVERRLCQIWEDYEEDRDATLSRTVSN